jgi:5-oxoprolinase (ATP-hydrolysing)
MADVVVDRQQPSSAVFSPGALEAAQAQIDRLRRKAYDALVRQGFEPEAMESTAYLNLRYQGTDTAIMIPRPDDDDFAAAFRKTYLREFGFDLVDRAILIDDIRVRARGRTAGLSKKAIAEAQGAPCKLDTVPCYFEDGWHDTDLYDLDALGAGHTLSGPAIIIHDTSTIMVEPDASALITRYGDVEITVGSGSNRSIGTDVDPIQLSIFSNLFMSIAEQMGRMLQKTAISTNIKERLDFSCALFGPNGELVANAPHLPVHLGAMSEAVKEQIRRQAGNLKPGDVLVSNHPAAGGSHLPDITVITPVFKGIRLFFGWPPGDTTPTSGASPPVPCPPTAGASKKKGPASPPSNWWRTASFRKTASPTCCWLRAPHPRTGKPAHLRHPPAGGQHFRPQSPGGRQPEGHRTGTGNGGALWPECRSGLYGPCPGCRRNAGANRLKELSESQGHAGKWIRCGRWITWTTAVPLPWP